MKEAGESLSSDFPLRGNAQTELVDHLQEMVGKDSVNQWERRWIWRCIWIQISYLSFLQ